MISATSGLSRIPWSTETSVERVEQRRVRRRIRVAEVVDRLDDAPAHQVEPDAVGQVPGELAVVPREPVGQVVERVGRRRPSDGRGRAAASVPSSRRSGAGRSAGGPRGR